MNKRGIIFRNLPVFSSVAVLQLVGGTSRPFFGLFIRYIIYDNLIGWRYSRDWQAEPLNGMSRKIIYSDWCHKALCLTTQLTTSLLAFMFGIILMTSCTFWWYHPLDSNLRHKLDHSLKWRSGCMNRQIVWWFGLLLVMRYVRLNGVLSCVICTNTGAPKTTMFTRFLFSLCTADRRSADESCPSVKFANDTKLVGKISNDEGALNHKQIENFVNWCNKNYLYLNLSKN